MLRKFFLRIMAVVAALTVALIPFSGEWNVEGLLYAAAVLIPAILLFTSSFRERRRLSIVSAIVGIIAIIGYEIYFALENGFIFILDYQRQTLGSGACITLFLFAAALVISISFRGKKETGEKRAKNSSGQNEMIYCPACGKKNRASAAFCKYCGFRLDAAKLQYKEKKISEIKTGHRGIAAKAVAVLVSFALLFTGVFGTMAYLGAAEIPLLAGILENNRKENETLPDHIAGEFTELNIADGDSAIAAAQDAAGLLGLDGAVDDLSVKNETQTGGRRFYRLQQNYYGIPVYGRTMTVVAGKDGTARGITSNVVELEGGISTEPSADWEEVKKEIKKYVKDNINGADSESISLEEVSDNNLTIYTFGEEPALAYDLYVQINGIGSVEFIVNADSAEVLSAVPSVYEEKIACYNADGSRRFDGSYNKDEDQYEMHDEDRDIYIYTYEGNDSELDSTKRQLIKSKEDNKFGNHPEDEQYYNGDTAVTYLANISNVYDFYTAMFDETAYGILYACFDDGYDSGNNALGGYTEENGKRKGYISMGSNTGVEGADVIGHEYTHVVTRFRVGWLATPIEHLEAGAINEGYSDIFGEIIQGYINSEEPDWINGDRVISNPRVNDYPENIDDKKPVECIIESTQEKFIGYKLKKADGTETYTDYSHGHCTVVSHAAYNMHTGIDGKYETLDMKELARLWYETLLLLPGDCTFQILREYMEITADLQELSDGQKECIRAAFDNAGIKSQNDGEETYSTAPEITVLDKKGDLYNDYTITVDGEKDTGFAWLGKEDYHLEIEVKDTNPEVLNLPRGVYTITVTDNFNKSRSVSKNVKVRLTNRKKTMRFSTNFGFDYTASTSAELAVYDINSVPYDDYTIQISGTTDEEDKTYENTREIGSSEKVLLSLPAGKYGFLLTDRKDTEKQRSFTLRITENALEKDINIKTNFGERSGEYNPAYIPEDAAEYNGHYYYVYRFDDEVDTWDEAREYCLQRSGYLAALTTAEEDEFVYSLLQESGCGYGYFGLYDSGYGQWEWSNGERFEYSNWAQGEPNAYGERYGMYDKGMGEKWNNGSFRNGTELNGTGFICEWGEYTPADAQSVLIPGDRTMSDERDIVLVLDSSGSMDGTPIEETKEASLEFIKTVLDEDASTGVVTYAASADVASDFCMNENQLDTAVNEISAGGGTNIESGLGTAYQMLQYSNARKKIIVLMSDGEPTDGRQGDSLVEYADSIKETGISIYTLGFFSELGEGNKASAQLLLEGIASEGCHYEVDNAGNLKFFFDDIADQINGQGYIYVRIACPVDVTVTYGGETLASEDGSLNMRTSFGTLTFEEAEESAESSPNTQEEESVEESTGTFFGFVQDSVEEKSAGTGDSGIDAEDNQVKILRLKDNAEYVVEIRGTGTGTMDYTIGFTDEDGEYSDFRRFEDIAITKQTYVETTAERARTTVLNVDEDGNGRYDLRYRAGENGTGEIVDYSFIIYIGVGTAAVGAAVAMIAVIRRKFRKNRKQV